MIKHVEPFVKKLIYEHSNPFNVLKDLYRAGVKYSQLLQELPTSIKEIVKIMNDEGYQRIPVVQDGKLMGLVTQSSIIRAVSDIIGP